MPNNDFSNVNKAIAVKMKLKNSIANCNIFQNIIEKIQYFGAETSLHGVGKVLPKNIGWFKRVFWLAVLICTSYGAAWIFLQSMKFFASQSVSYTVETSYLDWETPFPAVSVCETMDTDRIHAYLHEQNMPLSMAAFYKEINYWSSKFCNTCKTCKMNQTCAENIPQLVKDFRLKCPEILTECWWGNEPFSCCDRFKPLRTEYGVCYTFNSLITGNSSQIIRLSRRTGLKELVFHVQQYVNIRIHSPDETISVASENLLGKQSALPLISDFELFLKVEETTSDASVRRLPPATRGCLQWNERPENVSKWNIQRYTYSACILHCRAIAQYRRCNCTHHLMEPLEGIPMCNIEGQVCLSKFKDLNSITCDCPMACEETLYKMVHVFNERHTGVDSAELKQRGSRAVVKFTDLPTLRVRRQAMKDTLSLVVDVGGIGGVFFGASVLSVIEIVYLLCIRKNYTKNCNK